MKKDKSLLIILIVDQIIEKSLDKCLVRCPSCRKLYEVDTSGILTRFPHFECRACSVIFSFEFPPISGKEIIASIVHRPDSIAEAAETEISAVNPHDGVFFQAEPSLVQLWLQIFDDYEDRERHDEFLRRCRESEALPFAKAKYLDLQNAMGRDSICDEYLGKIEALLEVKTETHLNSAFGSALSARIDHRLVFRDFSVWVYNKTWPWILYWAPFVVSGAFILIGLSWANYRNMIGLGFFTAFFCYGLIVVFRGPIRISDFINVGRK